MGLRLGPETCRNLESALSREWLVTNGLGGYASGTVAGVNTRRYHGLLVASMNPPVQRMVLLAALEEWLLTSNEPGSLAAQEYWDGTVYPEGFAHLDAVELDGMLPVFRWTVEGRTIEKRIWMEHEANRSVISYRLVAGASTAASGLATCSGESTSSSIQPESSDSFLSSQSMASAMSSSDRRDSSASTASAAAWLIASRPSCTAAR